MRTSASCRSAKGSRSARLARHLLVACTFLSWGGSAHGWDVPGVPGSFQVHGFLTQAWILTSANDFFGKSEASDGGSFDFREIGLNGSWRIHPRLQFSAQGLARWAGEGDEGTPRLDYGYGDFTLLSDADDLWGVRGGRVPIPLGFYNQTRDVAATRPSILLPQSIYFDRTRDLALSGDGGYVYGERRTPWGNLFVDAGAGYPRQLKEEVEYALLGSDAPGDLDGKVSYVGRVLYEKDEGTVRAAVSGGEIHIDYEPGQRDFVPDGSFRFRPLIFSLQMNTERLSLTGEYALRFFRTDGFGPRDAEITGESYYLQAAYRFASEWEVMARYDVLYTDRADRNGSDFEAQSQLEARFLGTPVVPAHTRFAKDLTAGLRWDITPNWMARVEYHVVDGTAWITRLDNEDATDLDRYWNLFSALVSFRF